jgi:hypothetical protein
MRKTIDDGRFETPYHLGQFRRLDRLGHGGDRQAFLEQRACSRSSPMRLRQRVIDERSNTKRCRKNSSPQKY